MAARSGGGDAGPGCVRATWCVIAYHLPWYRIAHRRCGTGSVHSAGGTEYSVVCLLGGWLWAVRDASSRWDASELHGGHTTLQTTVIAEVGKLGKGEAPAASFEVLGRCVMDIHEEGRCSVLAGSNQIEPSTLAWNSRRLTLLRLVLGSDGTIILGYAICA